MTRLDSVLSDMDYIKDCLTAFKEIVNSGCCNVCDNQGCKYAPKPGELVRYNCPFFLRKYVGPKITEGTTMTLHLKSPLTDEQLALIGDYEMEHTDTIRFTTPSGKEVEFVRKEVAE